MNKKTLKIFTLFIIFITITVFVLFIFRIVSHLYFWIYIAIMALFAFKFLPELKKRAK